MTLEEFIKRNVPDLADFSREIGLKGNASIYRYLPTKDGKPPRRRPADRIMSNIRRVTKGQVTPNDFYRGVQ